MLPCVLTLDKNGRPTGIRIKSKGLLRGSDALSAQQLLSGLRRAAPDRRKKKKPLPA